ncbi:AraC family transcriptional regulator [Flavobacterium sp. LM5]|uniref:AraC family transcriptional regulator n=1 Tax=Flavobacterium sp. LM5 TaxID=1938610 RepID=UPI0009923941|nr:AraC family transcriptional regulator [Flavobacterium sp. LM5]OOV29547.1 AraC family transcriptional regulator [Flavobacterium sp. LM5]
MKKMEVALEVIAPSYGSSFTILQFDENTNSKSHVWHHHPEIEIVYVHGGSGKRQIGSHLSYFTEGDLILIGSHLPHCGFTNAQTGNESETVIQFHPDFLGDDFFKIPEMSKVSNLLQQAKAGIAFSGEAKLRIGEKVGQMNALDPFERLQMLWSVLYDMSNSTENSILNAEGFSLELQVQDNDRINVVFNHVKDHFQEPITLEEVAELVSMTIPSFCRYFKKITNKTFTTFVNEYRIVHACKLLTEKPMSINDVCFESGFNNFSHFNKSFKAYTGCSASQYRNGLKTIIK